METIKISIPFTICTVVLNDKFNLEKTFRTVLDQVHGDFEYIIIDGNSSDGTIELIKKYEEHIDYWSSEADNGIYDAMNKGIARANSEGTISDAILDLIIYSPQRLYHKSESLRKNKLK